MNPTGKAYFEVPEVPDLWTFGEEESHGGHFPMQRIENVDPTPLNPILCNHKL